MYCELLKKSWFFWLVTRIRTRDYTVYIFLSPTIIDNLGHLKKIVLQIFTTQLARMRNVTLRSVVNWTACQNVHLRFIIYYQKNPLNCDEIAPHVLYVIVFRHLICTKGQLISEATIFLAFKAPKKHTKISALASKMDQIS